MLQGQFRQDLTQFTEPGVLVGHPKEGPTKFVVAIMPFAAVEVQDVLSLTGEQLHVQVFPRLFQLL